MELLNIAIKHEGGVSKLAAAIGEKPNVVGNWKLRGLPKTWAKLLAMKYKRQVKAAKAGV